MNEYEKLAYAIKNKSRKNEWCYRLVAVFLGYAIAFAGGNFFRFNFEVVVLFIGLMFGAMRISKSLLRNMFLLEGAWNLLIDKGFDVASIIGKPYKTARLGKRMAFLGTLLGAFSGVVTVVDSSGSRNMYSENFENVVFVGTVIFFTFWIPQLVLLINKATAKRYVAKNVDMVASYAESLQAESIGDLAKAKQLVKIWHVPGVFATRTVTVLIAVSVVGNLYAVLDVKGTIKNAIAERKYGTQMEEVARVDEEADNAGTSEIVDSETESEETLSNPNGKGFYVTPDCLEVYLAYISSGTAATDYNKWQNKRFEDWERFASEPTHFAICGMHSGEPYLLLGAERGVVSGDSILFAERHGNDLSNCSIVTDWDIKTYGGLSDRQFIMEDELYIYNGEKEKDTKFVLHRTMVYVETEYEENMVEFLCYDSDYAGNVNNSDNDYNVKRGVGSGELLEIKWFSINDIDSARVYYEQFATSEEDLVD